MADFTAHILFPMSLRSVVGSINEIQRDMRISFCDGTQHEHSGFRGLVVEARDDFCLASAFLSADVVLAPGLDAARGQVVVDTQVFNTCLKAIGARHELRISRQPGDDDLEMALRVAPPSHAGSTFRIPTLRLTKAAMSLGDLQLDYRIELEMSEFREVIKMSRALQAQDITIQVLERPDGTARLVVAAGGNASMRYTFDSVSNRTDEPQPTEPDREDEEAGEAVVKFSQQFPVDYLALFLKSVDKSTVEFRLGNDQPLVMSYPLGEHGSSLTFIVAPRT